MANGDATTRQITVGVVIALVGFAIGTIGAAALQPNPYLEDRKFIEATITDLKASIVTLKADIDQLRRELRRNSSLHDTP